MSNFSIFLPSGQKNLFGSGLKVYPGQRQLSSYLLRVKSKLGLGQGPSLVIGTWLRIKIYGCGFNPQGYACNFSNPEYSIRVCLWWHSCKGVDCASTLIESIILHKIISVSEASGRGVFLYSVGSLNGCLSVRHFYISSPASCDGRKKKIA